MIPAPSEASLAMQLEFVADLSNNPRTHQYRIDLTELYRSGLPRERNYLLIDVDHFTVNQLFDVFQREVIDYYQQQHDQAQQILDRIRHDSRAER